MTFNPNEHLTDLRGKDYLEVKWRLVWFKEANPTGGISTDIIHFDPLVIKATITIDGVIVATGHGTADDSGKNVVWKGKSIEKAETAAIGRALAHAGYGTQFSPDDDEDGVVDSPVTRQKPAPSAGNPTPSATTQQTPKSPFGSQPDAKPTWLNTEVGKCWQALKTYLVSEKIYTNEFEMKNSFAKRGVTVDGNFTDEWKYKSANELVDFLRNRHQQEQNDIDFMGEPEKQAS